VARAAIAEYFGNYNAQNGQAKFAGFPGNSPMRRARNTDAQTSGEREDAALWS